MAAASKLMKTGAYRLYIGVPPYGETAFNPTTPATISAMHASRAGEALSANTRIPTVATPTAPMPVQIAYAVPTGIARSAWVSSHRLTAAAAAVATPGHRRVKASVYFRPIADRKRTRLNYRH